MVSESVHEALKEMSMSRTAQRQSLGFTAMFVTLACALLLGGPAADARAEAIVPVEGPWFATTTAGQPVSFEVEGGNVIDAHFGYDWADCGTYEIRARNTDPIDASGHWSYLGEVPTASIEGTFVAPDRLEGAVLTGERQTPNCLAYREAFVAVPGEGPPRAFAVQNADTFNLSMRPGRIIVTPRSLAFYRLRWHGFGGPVAEASGKASIRRGKTYWRPRVTLRFSSLIKDGPGTRIYSTMRWTFDGSLPPGFERHGSREFPVEDR
jgi:hypothetical protein